MRRAAAQGIALKDASLCSCSNSPTDTHLADGIDGLALRPCHLLAHVRCDVRQRAPPPCQCGHKVILAAAISDSVLPPHLQLGNSTSQQDAVQ